MQKLTKKETILREKDELDRAEQYAKKQRRQYLQRFGALVPYIINIISYIILATMILTVFFTGYILGDKNKQCPHCSITVYPCELPKTGAIF